MAFSKTLTSGPCRNTNPPATCPKPPAIPASQLCVPKPALQELKRGPEDFLLFTRDRNYKLVNVVLDGKPAVNRPPKAGLARQFTGLERIDNGVDHWKVSLQLEDGDKHGLTVRRILRSVDHRHVHLIKEIPAGPKTAKRSIELHYTHANE